MAETTISWSYENWITIFLMALIAFTVIGFGASFFAKRKGATAQPAPPSQPPQLSLVS